MENTNNEKKIFLQKVINFAGKKYNSDQEFLVIKQEIETNYNSPQYDFKTPIKNMISAILQKKQTKDLKINNVKVGKKNYNIKDQNNPIVKQISTLSVSSGTPAGDAAPQNTGGPAGDDITQDTSSTRKPKPVRMSPGEAGNFLATTRLSLQKTNLEKRLAELGQGSSLEGERAEINNTIADIEKTLLDIRNGVEVSDSSLRRIMNSASVSMKATQSTTLAEIEKKGDGNKELESIIERNSASLSEKQKEMFKEVMKRVSFVNTADFSEKAESMSSQFSQRIELISKGTLGMDDISKDNFEKLSISILASTNSIEDFSGKISELSEDFSDLDGELKKITEGLSEEDKKDLMAYVGDISLLSVNEIKQKLSESLEELGIATPDGERASLIYDQRAGLSNRDLKRYAIESKKLDQKAKKGEISHEEFEERLLKLRATFLDGELKKITEGLSEEDKKNLMAYVGDISLLSVNEIKQKLSESLEELGITKPDGKRAALIDDGRAGLGKRDLKSYAIESKKLDQKAKKGEISHEEFEERLLKLRATFDPKIFRGLGSGILDMAKAVKGSTSALQRMKDSSNMFVSEFGETYSRLKAERTKPLEGFVSGATEKIFTGNMVSKGLFMIPGVGPVLAGGFGLIKIATGGILKLTKSIFGAITSTFAVVGKVLSTMTSVAKGVLGRTIKWGLGGLAILTLLYKTGLLEKIPKIISNLWKTVYPMLTRIVETALQYANETIEHIIDLLRKGIETGLIKEFPKMILSFVRGIFSSKEVSSIGEEFSRFGKNLSELGGVVLEAITELWTGLKEVWTEELWPNYIKPAFEYLKENIPIWFNQLWDSLTKWYETSDIGKWIQEKIVEPLTNFFDKFTEAIKYATLALMVYAGAKLTMAGIRGGMALGRGVRGFNKWRGMRAARALGGTATKVGIFAKIATGFKAGLLGVGKLLVKGLVGGLAVVKAPIVLAAASIAAITVGWKLWQMHQEKKQHEKMMNDAKRMREAAEERNKKEGAIQKELKDILASNMKTNDLIKEQEIVEKRLDDLNESIKIGHAFDAEGNRLSKEQLIELRKEAEARQEALKNVVSTRQFTKEELESSEEGRELVSRLSPERLQELETTGKLTAQNYEEQSIGLRSSLEGRTSTASRAREIANVIKDLTEGSDNNNQLIMRVQKTKFDEFLSSMSPEERVQFGLTEGNMGGESLFQRKIRTSPGAFAGPGVTYTAIELGDATGRIIRDLENFAQDRERTLVTTSVELSVSEALEAAQKYIESQRKLEEVKIKEAYESSKGEVSEETRDELARLTSEVESARQTAMELHKLGAERGRDAEFGDGESGLMNQQAAAVGFYENFDTYIQTIRQGSGIGGIQGTRQRIEQMNVLSEMEERLKILGDDPEAEKLREAINELRDKIQEGSLTQEEANEELSGLRANLDRNSTLLKAEREAKKKEQEKREREELEAKGGLLGLMIDTIGASLGEEYAEATQKLKEQLGISGVKAAAEGNVGASAAAAATAESALEDDPNNYTESGQFDPDLAAQERIWREQDSAQAAQQLAAQQFLSGSGWGQFDPNLAAQERIWREQDSAQAAQQLAAQQFLSGSGWQDSTQAAQAAPSSSPAAASPPPPPSSSPAAPIPAASAQAAQAAGESASGLAAGASGTPGASASGGLGDYISRITRMNELQPNKNSKKTIKMNDDGSLDVHFEILSVSDSDLAHSTARDQSRAVGFGIIRDLMNNGVDRAFLESLNNDVNFGKGFEETEEKDGKLRVSYKFNIPKEKLPTEAASVSSEASTASSPPSSPAAPIPAASAQAAQAAGESASGLAAGASGTPGASASTVPSAGAKNDTASPSGGGSGGAGAAGMDPSLESEAAPSPAAPIPAASAQAAQAAGESASGLAAGASGTPGASESRVPNMDDLMNFMENASPIEMQKANVAAAERRLNTAKRGRTRGREERIRHAEEDLAEAKKILADMESGNYVAPEGPMIGPDDMDPSLESEAAPSPAAPIPAASAQAAQAAGESASGLAAGASGTPSGRMSAMREQMQEEIARTQEMQQKATNDAAEILSRSGNAVPPENIQSVQLIGGIPVKVKLKSGEEISLEDYHTEEEKSSVGRFREMSRSMRGGVSETPSSAASETVSEPTSLEAPIPAASAQAAQAASGIVSASSGASTDMLSGRIRDYGITVGEEDAESKDLSLIEKLESVQTPEAKELVDVLRDLIVSVKEGKISQEEANSKMVELGEELKNNSEIMDLLSEEEQKKLDEALTEENLQKAAESLDTPRMVNTNDIFERSNLANWYSSEKTTPITPGELNQKRLASYVNDINAAFDTSSLRKTSSEMSETTGASASGMSDASVGTGGAGGISAPATGGGSGGESSPTLPLAAASSGTTATVSSNVEGITAGATRTLGHGEAKTSSGPKITTVRDMLGQSSLRMEGLPSYFDDEEEIKRYQGMDEQSLREQLERDQIGEITQRREAERNSIIERAEERGRQRVEEEREAWRRSGGKGTFSSSWSPFDDPEVKKIEAEIEEEAKRTVGENFDSMRATLMSHSPSTPDMTNQRGVVGDSNRAASSAAQSVSDMGATASLQPRHYPTDEELEIMLIESNYRGNFKDIFKRKFKREPDAQEIRRMNTIMQTTGREVGSSTTIEERGGITLRDARENHRNQMLAMGLDDDGSSKVNYRYTIHTKENTRLHGLFGVEEDIKKAETDPQHQRHLRDPDKKADIERKISDGIEHLVDMRITMSKLSGNYDAANEERQREEIRKEYKKLGVSELTAEVRRISDEYHKYAIEEYRFLNAIDREASTRYAQSRLSALSPVGDSGEASSISPLPTTPSMTSASEINKSAAEIDSTKANSGNNATIINNNTVASSNNQNNTSVMTPSFSSRPSVSVPPLGMYSFS